VRAIPQSRGDHDSGQSRGVGHTTSGPAGVDATMGYMLPSERRVRIEAPLGSTGSSLGTPRRCRQASRRRVGSPRFTGVPDNEPCGTAARAATPLRLPERFQGDVVQHPTPQGRGARKCESAKVRKYVVAGCFPQADARTRTGDPFITSEVLYQLSYVGESAVDGIGRTAASRVQPPSTGPCPAGRLSRRPTRPRPP
jgi:hypothetical protein